MIPYRLFAVYFVCFQKNVHKKLSANKFYLYRYKKEQIKFYKYPLEQNVSGPKCVLFRNFSFLDISYNYLKRREQNLRKGEKLI